jgi:hypothetical protein
MVECGYVRDTHEAFDRWIGQDGPAYVAGERLSMAEALPLMRRNGFVPVLAHPAELEKDDMTLRMLLETWQKQGLMGVEVYHPSQQKRGADGQDIQKHAEGMISEQRCPYRADEERGAGNVRKAEQTRQFLPFDHSLTVERERATCSYGKAAKQTQQ